MTYIPNLPSMDDLAALQAIADKAMKDAAAANERAAAADSRATTANNNATAANDRATAANANASAANDRATTANANAAAANNNAATANTMNATLQAELATVNSRIAGSVPWLGMQIVPVPALTLGGSTDITITWATAAPAADYTVVASIQGAGSLVGTMSVIVKPGTKTTTSVVITVKSSIALSANTAYIHVLGGRSANQ